MNQMKMPESATREALIQKWKRTASGVMDGWRYAAEFIAETIESNSPEVALRELKGGLTRAGCMAVSEYYEAAIGEVTALIEATRKMPETSVQTLVALILEVAVPGGIPAHEFSRPGGWLERAQCALQGRPIELDLMAKLHELRAKNDDLRSTLSTVYHALDDASSVVDASDDEDYAYQAELEAGASALGISRDTPTSSPSAPSPSM